MKCGVVLSSRKALLVFLLSDFVVVLKIPFYSDTFVIFYQVFRAGKDAR